MNLEKMNQVKCLEMNLIYFFSVIKNKYTTADENSMVKNYLILMRPSKNHI